MSDELTKFVDEYLDRCPHCKELQAEIARQRQILMEMNENQSIEIEKLQQEIDDLRDGNA
jgi:predicted anti-sigma-YlaC factor YlaD